MKTIFTFSVVFLFFICFSNAQIRFEEIEHPNDFSIDYISKSPNGEYFMQSKYKYGDVYTSNDLTVWNKRSLPENIEIFDMEFFNDGTPIIKSERQEHLIRKPDGNWYTMSIGNGWRFVEASDIHNDTLFVYYDQIFAYSINKAQSFKNIFVASEGIIDHTSTIFRYENYFILHHTAGASDYLSIFKNSGERIFFTPLNINPESITMDDCGRVLFMGYRDYILFDVNTLTKTTGDFKTLMPFFNSSTFNERLVYKDGKYFTRFQNKVYKTGNCDFNWTIALEDNILSSYFGIQVGQNENLILYREKGTNRNNFFFEKRSRLSGWEQKNITVNRPFLFGINEAIGNIQYCLSDNAVFTKTSDNQNWRNLTTNVLHEKEIAYSPNGTLYMYKDNIISYSENNGQRFTPMNMPPLTPPFNYEMTVLDDGVIFLFSSFNLSYLTFNNGQTWTQTPITINGYYESNFKLIGDYVYAIGLDFSLAIERFNIYTGELEAATDLPINSIYPSDLNTISDDGTFYFYSEDFSRQEPTGLYSYRFGHGSEYVTSLPVSPGRIKLVSIKDELFLFAQDNYYTLNGTSWKIHNYFSLSNEGFLEFYVSSNYYLYAINDNTKIFRSEIPLGYDNLITGKVVFDTNDDCNTELSDPLLKDWKIKAENGNFLKIKSTRSDGSFSMSVPDGTYNLSCIQKNNSWELCEEEYQVIINQNQPVATQDFAVKALEDCANLNLDFSAPLLRRCFENDYTIRVSNNGPLTAIGTKLTLKLDPFFNFISATIPFTRIDNHTLEFDLGSLDLDEVVSFKIRIEISCDAVLGMDHCLEGSLEADNLCGNPTILESVNYIECQENIGAYDPNDKRIFNKNGKEVSQVDLDEYIYYHIRFQNTGTDTAFTVRVLDTLAEELEINTFEMLSASHAYEYNISKGPVLEVLFKDILLVDSFKNEPESHGYFKFKIKPQEGFGYGTMISNEAAIYFDFNDPVITNEAVLTIMKPSSVRDKASMINFEVYPNPVRDELRIDISDMDLSRVDEIEIVNQLGKIVFKSNFEIVSNIKTSSLSAGMYMLVLKDKGELVGSRKFVKQ